MLQEVFYWIFNMSITASVVGLVVVLIRSIPKIPKRLSVFLWIIPFFRMIIPLGLNSPYSFMSLISRITTKTVVIYQPAENFSFSMTNSVMAADRYFPITYKVNLLSQVFRIASVVWIIVFLAIALTLVILYCTTLHEIKDATHLRDNIFLTEKIVSPTVYGMIRPRIILPKTYDEKNLDYALMHEKVHIHCGDNLWRVVAFFVTAIHWFNPFAWLFLRQFLVDIELSCDERVLAKLDEDGAKEYARSLLDSTESMTIFASAFGGAKIRTRIENILSFKKITRVALLGSILLITAIFYVLLTNAD